MIGIDNIKCAPGFILIEKIKEVEKKTDGGVVLPKGSRTSSFYYLAKVVKMGPKEEFWKSPMPCKEGDYIFFQKYKGDEVILSYTDREFVFGKYMHVLCVVTGIEDEINS